MASKFLTRIKGLAKKVRKSSREHPGKAILCALAIVLAASPIVFLGVMLARYSVNVPFWDQWVYVPLVDKWQSGSLGFHDLWVQHNEHRILVPKFFQLMMSSVTGWNIRFEVMMNLVFAITSFGLMLAMLRRTFNKKWTPFFVVMPLIALLLFSPVQYINWIWGFQLAWFLSVAAVMASLWGLTFHSYKTIDQFFIFALVMAVTATFSVGNGMLIWAAGLLILVLRHATKRHYLVWGITAVLSIAGYLFKLERANQESPISLLMHRTGDVVGYIFQYLGRNLAETPHAAKTTGIVLVVSLFVSVVLLARKKQLAQAAPWLAIASYGLLTAVLAAFSRMSNYGVDHSMVFSYTTMSVLFVIGVLVTVAYTIFIYVQGASVPALRRYLTVAFAVGLLACPAVIGYWHNYTKGTGLLKDLGKHLSTVRHCVFTATSETDDCLTKAYPYKDYAWKQIETLRRINWDGLGKEK